MNATKSIALCPTRCAICHSFGNAAEIYPSRFSFDDLNPAIFSARRLPDRVHYRMVRCRSCGLLRSDPVAEPELLASLYRSSSFDYAAEIANLKATYGRYLRTVVAAGAATGSFLEIGCGNGFFLEEAMACGFDRVSGVEPSAHAVHQAAPAIRDHVICDVMRPGLFPPAGLDVIALFQVFDHLPDPGAVLQECRRILRPGGFILILNHNAASLSARLLGERSPIIDVEHTFLYDRKTLGLLVRKHGFSPVSGGIVWNRYSLGYVSRLVPLPARWKRAVAATLTAFRLDRINVSVPLGNLYLIARNQPGV